MNRLSLLVGLLVQLSAAHAAEKGLEFTFWASKSEYPLGEPVEVTFSWKNVSPQPLKIERWRGPTAGVLLLGRGGALKDFQIIGPDGKPLPYHGIFKCGAPRGFDVLQPGEERRSSYTLTGVPYEMSVPGVYVLKSAYASYTYEDVPELETEGPHWDGLIIAHDVTITIRSDDDHSLTGSPNKGHALDAQRDARK